VSPRTRKLVLPTIAPILSDAQVAAELARPGRVSLDEEVYLAQHYAAQVHNQLYIRKKATDREMELSEEVGARLEQMNFLLKSVAVLLTEHSRRVGAEKPRADPREQLWFMMFLYAEAFYYFAHRLQDILCDAKLPHISSFRRCHRITLIRNCLIEHQYRSTDFGGAHAMMSSRDGPVILVSGAGAPKELESRRNPGLFRNAREVRDHLRPVLERALAALGGPVDREALGLAVPR
jgi:hypothetical protein